MEQAEIILEKILNCPASGSLEWWIYWSMIEKAIGCIFVGCLSVILMFFMITTILIIYKGN